MPPRWNSQRHVFAGVAISTAVAAVLVSAALRAEPITVDPAKTNTIRFADIRIPSHGADEEALEKDGIAGAIANELERCGYRDGRRDAAEARFMLGAMVTALYCVGGAVAN